MATEESFAITMEELSKVHLSDIHSISKIKMMIDGIEIEETMESILVDGVFYIKDMEEDVWLEMGEFPVDIFGIDQSFLENYDSYTISNDGETQVDGETVTKYTLKITLNEAMNILSDEYAAMFDILVSEEDLGFDLEDIEYVFAFYVSEDEEIVKLVYDFDFMIEEEDEVVGINIALTVEYKNRGTVYDIKAPEGAILIIIDFDDFDFDFELEY